MKEYKLIRQKGTAIKKDEDFQDLLNSYAKTGWRVINIINHRTILKALLERDKKD